MNAKNRVFLSSSVSFFSVFLYDLERGVHHINMYLCMYVQTTQIRYVSYFIERPLEL